jgi:hypothetical protein
MTALICCWLKAQFGLASASYCVGLQLLAISPLFWLRDGIWTPIEIHTIWQMLHRREPKFSNFKWFGFEWVGVRKLIVLFLRARTSSRP